MKTFQVELWGSWHFDYEVEAESKQEAAQRAKQDMKAESGSIDLEFDRIEVEEDR